MNPTQTAALKALQVGLRPLVTATLQLDNGRVEVGVQDGRRFVVLPTGQVRQDR